ncbi:hypothetical protein ABK040_001295 [Willaertia magna]
MSSTEVDFTVLRRRMKECTVKINVGFEELGKCIQTASDNSGLVEKHTIMFKLIKSYLTAFFDDDPSELANVMNLNSNDFNFLHKHITLSVFEELEFERRENIQLRRVMNNWLQGPFSNGEGITEEKDPMKNLENLTHSLEEKVKQLKIYCETLRQSTLSNNEFSDLSRDSQRIIQNINNNEFNIENLMRPQFNRNNSFIDDTLSFLITDLDRVILLSNSLNSFYQGKIATLLNSNNQLKAIQTKLSSDRQALLVQVKQLIDKMKTCNESNKHLAQDISKYKHQVEYLKGKLKGHQRIDASNGSNNMQVLSGTNTTSILSITGEPKRRTVSSMSTHEYRSTTSPLKSTPNKNSIL